MRILLPLDDLAPMKAHRASSPHFTNRSKKGVGSVLRRLRASRSGAPPRVYEDTPVSSISAPYRSSVAMSRAISPSETGNPSPLGQQQQSVPVIITTSPDKKDGRKRFSSDSASTSSAAAAGERTMAGMGRSTSAPEGGAGEDELSDDYYSDDDDGEGVDDGEDEGEGEGNPLHASEEDLFADTMHVPALMQPPASDMLSVADVCARREGGGLGAGFH